MKTIQRLAAGVALCSLALAVNGNSDILAPPGGEASGEFDAKDEDGNKIADVTTTNGGKTLKEESVNGSSATWDYDAGSGVYERTPGNNNTPTLCLAKKPDGTYDWELVNNEGDIVGSGSMCADEGD